MDDRGRLAQPLKRTAPTRSPAAAAADAVPLRVRRRLAPATQRRPSRLGRALRRVFASMLELRVPRGTGTAATVLVILASLGYGAVQGDHLATLNAWYREARDSVANAVGFRIVSLALSGNRHVSREEVLTIAGVTGHTSLLFLDV